MMDTDGKAGWLWDGLGSLIRRLDSAGYRRRGTIQHLQAARCLEGVEMIDTSHNDGTMVAWLCSNTIKTMTSGRPSST